MIEKQLSLDPINGCTCNCVVEAYSDTDTVYYGYVYLANSESCADISSSTLEGLKGQFKLIVELDSQIPKLNEILVLESENWTGEIVTCLIDGYVLAVYNNKSALYQGEFYIPLDVLNHIETYFKTIVSLLEVGVTVYRD